MSYSHERKCDCRNKGCQYVIIAGPTGPVGPTGSLGPTGPAFVASVANASFTEQSIEKLTTVTFTSPSTLALSGIRMDPTGNILIQPTGIQFLSPGVYSVEINVNLGYSSGNVPNATAQGLFLVPNPDVSGVTPYPFSSPNAAVYTAPIVPLSNNTIAVAGTFLQGTFTVDVSSTSTIYQVQVGFPADYSGTGYIFGGAVVATLIGPEP
ncbi:MAG: hypothetical protein ACYCQJ_15135 [Nitrososphaerales archaeon]